ncbi:hypothetical protein [Microcoleus sp. S13_C5]|uniref:hypothetical protein n=1 Tax=Microcoleus sp. S13_C5 TaxID=3055411 RepID=UPI002FD56FD7
MLDIFILISTSSSSHAPISPSIMQVQPSQPSQSSPPSQSSQSRKPSPPSPDDYSKCKENHAGIQPKMILVAMSNVEGFTQNQLLQQLDGTTVLDEDLELSDEELELAQGGATTATSKCSDVFVGGKQIISFPDIQQFVERPERQQELINYIRHQFERNHIPVGNQGHPAEQIYALIALNIGYTAPINIKRVSNGFRLALTGTWAGQVCYTNQGCQY